MTLMGPNLSNIWAIYRIRELASSRVQKVKFPSPFSVKLRLDSMITISIDNLIQYFSNIRVTELCSSEYLVIYGCLFGVILGPILTI